MRALYFCYKAYATKENNAKRADVKITQLLPSSLTFPEAVEVPNIVWRKLCRLKIFSFCQE